MTQRTDLNVLVSSSRQWNPGDEFILIGTRRILELVLGSSPNYILWNRNPDLFVDRWRDPVFKPTLLSNSAIVPSLDLMDLVVFAGTPEWSGGPVERIHRDLLRYPRVPLLALGIGGCGAAPILTSLEREVFLRENTLVVCRDLELAEAINAQIGDAKAKVLPCPALFCFEGGRPRSVDSFDRTAPMLGVQGDTVENQAIPTVLAEQLTGFVRDRERSCRFQFVAHYIEEFMRFTRIGARNRIFYSYEPLDYLAFYRDRARCLVTSRLHGAIASLSCGTPACLIECGSARVSNAAATLGEVLPRLGFEEALEWAVSLTPECCQAQSASILTLKKTALCSYILTITAFIDQLAGHRLPWNKERASHETPGTFSRSA